MFDRCLRIRDMAARLDCSHEQVRLICLPFDDPARRVPGAALVERIVELTAGDVPPASFYPAHLNEGGRE